MENSKNDKAWQTLFQRYNILEQIEKDGHYVISSSDINTVREARLMTKFDFSSQLPEIFKLNNLAILPINRGNYIIGRFEIFHSFQGQSPNPIYKDFPSYLQSINYKDISSEAVALNCAFISRILEDFTEESLLPTVCGRMKSSCFDFQILNKQGYHMNIHVNNSQIEIDGGYEGQNSLILVEAKNVLSDDFIIRQLYYPYRAFKDRINKPVRPVYLTYSNGIFRLREYRFENPNIYNSLCLVKCQDYSIIESKLTLEKLEELTYSTPYRLEPPDVPFPQADDFNRIVNLCELIYNYGPKSKADIAEENGFVKRQADYYSNAAIYLGLLSKDTSYDGLLKLTEKGEHLFNVDLYHRQLEFIKTIICHGAFGETLKQYLFLGNIPTKYEIVRIMQSVPNIKIKQDSEKIFLRRAQTVASWVKWIIDKIER